MLEPAEQEMIEGHAEVKAVFTVGKTGKAAGCLVRDGKIARNARVRVLRKGKPVHDGAVASLRRFKEDVREAAAGFECGVSIEGFTDFQEGDVLEAYRRQRER